MPSHRRKHLLTEYKNGKGFSYFDTKFLQEVLYNPISDDSPFCFLMAKVTPSQNVKHIPHTAWVLIEKATGTIRSAYCTCMAGMFSQCNHIAAVLFKVDWVWTISEKSVTSNPCQWNAPGEKVLEPCKIGDMAVYKPEKAKSGVVRNINSASKRLFTTQRSRSDTPFTLDDWAGVLYDQTQDAVAFNYAESGRGAVYTPEADLNVERHEETQTSTFIPRPLLEVARDFVSVDEYLEHITSCPGDLVALEEATRNQNSPMWATQRVGRIGASIAHACKTKMLSVENGDDTSVENAVAAVLGKGPDISKLPAVKYGREKEKEARKAYTRDHRKQYGHEAEVTLSGLVAHKELCYVSASPDGLVKCECGVGVLEIKCPYSCAGKAPGIHLPFLHNKGGRLHLRESHPYHTQCQQQLCVTGLQFCDFYVYCGEGLFFLERIFPDVAFMAKSLQLLKDFYTRFVAPAIISLAKTTAQPTQVQCSPLPPPLTITVSAPCQMTGEAPRVLLKVSVNAMPTSS